MNRIIAFAICIYLFPQISYGTGGTDALPVILQMRKGDKGLDSKTIYRLTFDPFGLLWLASGDGISIYDGFSFKSFEVPGNDQEIISASRIENYWYCFTYSGNILQVDLLSRQVVLLDGTQLALRDESPYSFIYGMLRNDNLYFINTAGICYTTTFPVKRSSTLTKDTAGFFSHLITNEASRGAVADGKSLSEFLQAQFQIRSYKVKISEEFVIVNSQVYSNSSHDFTCLLNCNKAAPDTDVVTKYWQSENQVVVSYLQGRGLEVYQKDGNNIGKLLMKWQIPEVEITDFEVDNSGNIWVSTLRDGLWILIRRMPNATHFECKDTTLYHSRNIQYIYSDSLEQIFTYRDGTIGYHTQPKEIRIKTEPQLKDNFIKLLAKDSLGNMRVYANNGVYLIDEKKKVKKLFSYGSAKDAYRLNDSILVSAHLGNYTLVSVNDSVQIFKSPIIPSVSIALHQNNLYFGTTHGLYKGENLVKSLERTRILKLRSFNEFLFAGTTNGLYIIQNDSIVYHFSKKDGLASGFIKQVEFDPHHGYYYVLSNNNLVCLNDNFQTVESFPFLNQYRDLLINSITIDHQYLWIATNQGYFKQELIKDKIIKNEPVLKMAFRKNDSDAWMNTQKHRCKYGKDSYLYFMSFSQDLISGAGIDTWFLFNRKGDTVLISPNALGNEFKLRMPDPGNYKIQVSRQLRSGGSIESFVFDLVVLPLWHQSYPVRALLVLILLSLLFLSTYIYFRNSSQKKYAEVRREAEYLNLRNQMQLSRLKPHFIFNSFTPLQTFILKGDQMGALDYLQKLSQLLRDYMFMFTADEILLSKEVAFLERYLYIQSTKRRGQFTYTIEIDPVIKTDLLFIPPMIIQPLIENCIEHGERPDESPLHIQVHFFKNDTQLIIIVRDNGRGFESLNFHENHALDIIKRRLDMINTDEKKSSIAFYNQEGAVVKITLEAFVAP